MKCLAICFCSVLLFLHIEEVTPDVILEIKMDKFVAPLNLYLAPVGFFVRKECCDGGPCQAPCSPIVFILSLVINGSINQTVVSSPIKVSSSTMNFTNSVGNLTNPIQFHIPSSIIRGLQRLHFRVAVDNGHIYDQIVYLSLESPIPPRANSMFRFPTIDVDRNTKAKPSLGYRLYCKNCSTGDDCERSVNINEVCTSEGNVVCAKGWQGTLCAFDVNECLNIPCLHGGNCTNSNGSYICSCGTGWTGANCDVEINECRKIPCRHGGTCINTPGSYKCACQSGWTGTDCQLDIDECQLQPCPRLCSNTPGSFKCSCPSGLTGNYCELDVNECTINPCKNNTICSNFIGGYNCTCANGWKGTDCGTDVDECLSAPCLNNGTCHNTQGAFECKCTDKWIGTNCDNATNALGNCKLGPCVKNGTCVNEVYKTSLGISIKCFSDTWLVDVVLSELLSCFPKIVTSDIYLGKERCGSKLYGDKLTFNYSYNDNDWCGNKLQISFDHLLVNNELVYSIHDPQFPFIMREYKFRVSLQCNISNTETIYNHFKLYGQNHQQTNGSFRIRSFHFSQISFYEDENYLNKRDGYPLVVHAGEMLYVKVYTDSMGANIKMVLKECYTKPNPTSSDSLKFYLIRDGCPADMGVNLLNQSLHESKFGFQVFEYANDHRSIYLYCTVKFCDINDTTPPCDKSCNQHLLRQRIRGISGKPWL